jgi:hypothetical protein
MKTLKELRLQLDEQRGKPHLAHKFKHSTGIGAAIGGIAGYALTKGRGKGKALGTAIGGLAGAKLGAMQNNKIARHARYKAMHAESASDDAREMRGAAGSSRYDLKATRASTNKGDTGKLGKPTQKKSFSYQDEGPSGDTADNKRLKTNQDRESRLNIKKDQKSQGKR